MKKSIKRAIATCLVAVLGIAAAACGSTKQPGGDDIIIDERKTQLYIANYDGGVGREWLDAVAAMFEEQYKDEEFEAGKKGVQVVVHNNKDYNGSYIINKMASYTHDVFFTEDVNYYDHVAQGNFVDISDIVTADLGDFGETGVTIEKKMDTDLAAYYKHVNDGKYYALPFYDGFYGFMYDIQLFENNCLYFAKEPVDLGDGEYDYFVEDGKDVSLRSAGPDGDFETEYDNGLPSTYDEFEMLLENMLANKMVPFIYSGAASSYVKRSFVSVWANNEGKEQMMLNFNFGSDTEANKATTLIDVNSSGVVTPIADTTITSSNGYMLQKQAGKYYALKLLDSIANGNQKRNLEQNSRSHTDTQNLFLLGKLNSSATKYGFLVDGSWWENEASSVFANNAITYGDNAGKQARKFGFLPMPKVSDSSPSKNTLISLNASACFVNKYGRQPELGKLFLKFAHTNKALSTMNAISSVTRPFSYTISGSDQAQMTDYAKNLYELKKNSNVVYPYSNNRFFVENGSYFNIESWAWRTSTATDPFDEFLSKNAMSPERYFNALYTKVSEDSIWK